MAGTFIFLQQVCSEVVHLMIISLAGVPIPPQLPHSKEVW